MGEENKLADREKRLRMAVIAGASEAIKYKEKHPHALEQEILRYVTQEARKIVSEIDEGF